ncbi:glutathione peroxidase [Actinomycetospora sp. TBRC 11914]|uniref:glutathione peroxidase n=1 Tax=Actinomycetospora sp. TBRC 11914 TaxID=2729387 RepID=UPI00145C62DC|nr:glutathione peroxidase [Actinomycetospora sp. TBRC 11914]NMO88361.1 glutathione peroxidase [Actinomycetospora sp. TBRC 11914]
MTTVHDFSVSDAEGATVPLADYAGRVLLIVNVASKCGLTPQYEGLEALHRTHQDRGLTILGVPCNQFMEQEPGTDAEIQEFCRTTYDVTFPVLAKVDVNGPDASPLFAFLRAEAPGDFGPAYGSFHEAISRLRPDAAPDEVKWNFTKFLVDRDGTVLRRYEPPVLPAQIAPDLDELLAHPVEQRS